MKPLLPVPRPSEIAAARRKLRITQHTAAHLAGVTQAAWSRYETGAAIMPRMKFDAFLAAADDPQKFVSAVQATRPYRLAARKAARQFDGFTPAEPGMVAKLREMRLNAGTSTDTLAQLLYANVATYEAMESGRAPFPKVLLETLLRKAADRGLLVVG